MRPQSSWRGIPRPYAPRRGRSTAGLRMARWDHEQDDPDPRRIVLRVSPRGALLEWVELSQVVESEPQEANT